MVKSSVDLVKPKNLLSVLQSNGDLASYIADKLKEVPNLYENRCNPDLILYICNCIENNLNKNTIASSKVDKKALFFQILFKLIPIIPDSDKVIIDQILEHLHSSGQIAKVGVFKTSISFVKSFFLAKK